MGTLSQEVFFVWCVRQDSSNKEKTGGILWTVEYQWNKVTDTERVFQVKIIGGSYFLQLKNGRFIVLRWFYVINSQMPIDKNRWPSAGPVVRSIVCIYIDKKLFFLDTSV